jgi:hypothetical protein
MYRLWCLLMTEKRIVIHTTIEIQEREDIEHDWNRHELQLLIETYDRSGIFTISDSMKSRLRENLEE